MPCNTYICLYLMKYWSELKQSVQLWKNWSAQLTAYKFQVAKVCWKTGGSMAESPSPIRVKEGMDNGEELQNQQADLWILISRDVSKVEEVSE